MSSGKQKKEKVLGTCGEVRDLDAVVGPVLLKLSPAAR
jgi:hypothetical protein